MGYNTTGFMVTEEDIQRQLNSNRYLRNHSEAALHAAFDEWGHSDEYSNGYDARVERTIAHPPMSGDAMALFFAKIDRNEIEHNAHVIPLIPEDKVKRTTRKIIFDVTPEQVADLRSGNRDNAQEILEAALGKQGISADGLSAFEIIKLPAPLKPKFQRSEGTLVTKYFIHEDSSYNRKEFDTMPEARAHGMELMEKNPRLSSVRVASRQFRLADDGAENKFHGVITRPERTGKVTMEYSIDSPRSAKFAIENYSVSFFYHS